MGLGPLSDDRTPKEKEDDELRSLLLRLAEIAERRGTDRFELLQAERLDCFGRVALPHRDLVVTLTKREDPNDGW